MKLNFQNGRMNFQVIVLLVMAMYPVISHAANREDSAGMIGALIGGIIGAFVLFRKIFK